MNQDIAIKVENITKSYKLYASNHDRIKEVFYGQRKKFHQPHFALNAINFEVKRGETIGIIGKNGSGKSTLLKIITGVLTPTTGTVTVNGKISALLELGAGFNPDYTGIENIYLQCQLMGYTTPEIDAKLSSIIDFADIGEFVNQPVKIYSSGMFVRLAFAVQACVEPDIFIVDEALAVGDIFFRQKCYQYLEHLRKKGTSILLVTHAMLDVEQFCQNALLLDQGNPVFFGNAADAVKRYCFLEQKERESAFSVPSTSEIVEENKKDKGSDTKLAFWPSAEAFLDIHKKEQITNGWARCSEVAICNDKYEPCFIFKQGETAHFFYAFEVFQDMEVPTAGIVLHNDKGIMVHGKGSMFYNTPVPNRVKKGSVVKFHQKIKLDLAWGAYTFDIGMGTFSQEHYQQRTRYTWEELASIEISVCCFPKVHYFQVGRRIPTEFIELSHHGIADLPGSVEMLGSD